MDSIFNKATTTANNSGLGLTVAQLREKKSKGLISSEEMAQLQLGSLKHSILALPAGHKTLEEALLGAYRLDKQSESATSNKMSEVEKIRAEREAEKTEGYNSSNLNVVSMLILMVGHVKSEKMNNTEILTVCFKALKDRNDAENAKYELVANAMQEAVSGQAELKIEVRLGNL